MTLLLDARERHIERLVRVVACGLVSGLSLLLPVGTLGREGSELENSLGGSAPDTAYRLGASDVLTITVYEHPDLSGDYTVYADGTIVFPLLGQVPLEDRSTSEAKDLISSQLERDYIHDPIVTLTVKEHRSKKVTLLGHVGKPGVYYLDAPLRLLELLIKADGLSNDFGNPGNNRQARIVRNPRAPAGRPMGDERLTTIYVELQELLAGKPEHNVLLGDGDLIYIPRQTATVHVVGEVNQPGAFPFEKEMTVLKLVTLAGGATRAAAIKHIHALRVQDDELIRIALAMTDLVQPEDIIEVPMTFW